MVVFSWLWQLPQNILGFILTRKYEVKSVRTVAYLKTTPVYFKPFFRSGVCLGDYIIIDRWHLGRNGIVTKRVICHEYGHHRQSLILGWLYLPIVGLPSLCRIAWNRLFHRKWTNKQREDWYFKGYPERWADILGGVIRD